MNPLAWLLWGLHLVLNGVVVYTDLRYRRVYQPWTLCALAVGLVTALSAPFPLFNLLVGLGFFAVGYLRWQRAQQGGASFGGGDVWMLAYLGLTFGPALIAPLGLGILVILLGLALKRIELQGSLPAAGILGLGVLLWLGLALLIGAHPLNGLPLDSPARYAPAAVAHSEQLLSEEVVLIQMQNRGLTDIQDVPYSPNLRRSCYR